jgi:hypothetical protein
MRKIMFAAAASAVALAGAPADAATFTQYTDRTVFEAAAGALSKETFNSYVTDTDLTNKTIDFDGFMLSTSFTAGTPIGAFIDAPPVLQGTDPTANVHIALYSFSTFYSEMVLEFAAPTTAFGANFTSGFVNRIFLDVEGTAFEQQTSGDGFFGFTSDTPFTRIVFKPRTNSGFRMTMDNVSYSAVPTGVPEPASWAMMIAGFGLAGAAMRARPRLRNTAAA